MLKTIKTIKFITALAVVMILPMTSLADHSDNYGGFEMDYNNDYWSGSPSSYDYDYYSPVYQDQYDYTPYDYPTADYGYGGYQTPSYGYDYPSYSTPSYGSQRYPSYGGVSYGGTSVPSSNVVSNVVRNTNTSNSNSNSESAAAANSNSVSSSNNVNNNVNNNNVYVYTNPSGNAVVNNPAHQYLNVYCIATPTNPRIGQTVTVTAYATGGIGDYSYTWGGDAQYSTGPSTYFTSSNAGTKNITVTVRSGQEVKTASCSVTFTGTTQVYNYGYNNYPTYTSTAVAGTPVSSVYVQPGQIKRVTSGTPVSGVYLNDLPATGIDLNWKHYMGAFMVIVLGSVMFLMSRSREKLYATVE